MPIKSLKSKRLRSIRVRIETVCSYASVYILTLLTIVISVSQEYGQELQPKEWQVKALAEQARASAQAGQAKGLSGF